MTCGNKENSCASAKPAKDTTKAPAKATEAKAAPSKAHAPPEAKTKANAAPAEKSKKPWTWLESDFFLKMIWEPG